MGFLPNVFQVHQFLTALCVLFFIVGAKAQNIRASSLEFATKETFGFRVSVEEIFSEAMVTNTSVVISHQCDNNITFFCGKCDSFFYGSTVHQNLSILFKDVDAVLELLDMKCAEDGLIDGTLQVRIVPSVSMNYTTCKMMVFINNDPINETRIHVVHVPDVEDFNVTEEAPLKLGWYWMIPLGVVPLLVLSISACIIRFLIAVWRWRKENVKRNARRNARKIREQDADAMPIDDGSIHSDDGEITFKDFAVKYVARVKKSQKSTDVEEDVAANKFDIVDEHVAIQIDVVAEGEAAIQNAIVVNQAIKDAVDKLELKYTANSDTIVEHF